MSDTNPQFGDSDNRLLWKILKKISGGLLPPSVGVPPADIPWVFSGSPTDGNMRNVATYALYNNDLTPSVTGVTYLLSNGGFDIYGDNIATVDAPRLTVVGEPGSNNYISGPKNLQRISCPELVSVYGTVILALSSATLTQVDFPKLEVVEQALNLETNSGLVNLRFPALAVCPTIQVYQCALSQTSVDNILADLVANNWGGPGQLLKLEGGTNAAPGVQGALDVITLQGRGATVTTN